ncbi:SpoIIE family protein phosphatase [Kitasatospora camelliae]|uniref:protein-serine/threonine phosphatase n=1 Tax=Kitasatospora camelliae TaxID=3156397 RepID=A0AAU8K1L7_9ACTN
MDSRRFPFVDSMAGALLDADAVIVGWTPAAEELLAYRAEQVCGRPVRELLADRDSWPDLLAGYRDGVPWSGETVVRDGRGERLEIVFRVLPMARPASGDDPAHYLALGAPAALVARWRQDHAFTRELFLQDRVGLAVFDEQLRLVRTNTHLLPYSGVPVDLSGHRLADFLRAEDAEAVERHLWDVLRTGSPLVRAEERVRTLDDPRGGVVMAISAFRMQADGGRVIGLTALFNDVTEPHRARIRLELLHRATAAVGGSLSVTGTGEELASVLVPGLADRVVVDIAEAVFSGEEPGPDRDGFLLLRRTSVGDDDGPAGPAPGSPVLARAELAGTAGVDPEAAAAGRGPGELTVPLRARGLPLGRITARRDPGRLGFEPADLDLLREIAGRASLALDNARRYTREHRAAVGLQRSLLPPAEARTAAVTTAGVYLPTDPATGVGGDWFDVIPLSSARVALVAGDVVGHGLQATATMGRLRTAVRTLADLDLDPDELLVHLDDLVSQLVVEADEPDGDEWRARTRVDPVGATCVYAVYDPVSGRCSIAAAGHPPPAVVRPDGGVEYVALNPGPPLGVNGLPFEVTEIEPPQGGLLALYTDGLIEGGDGDLDQGMAELGRRLTDVMAADRPLRDCVRQVVSGLPAHRLADDVTLLLARIHRVPESDTAVWSIPADPAAVGGVRESASRRLREWGLEDLVFTTELVLSELVTNAIRYAGGPVEVRLIRAERLTCEVSDPSATQPRMRRARLTDEGGRGLYLVAQLTTRWGSRYTRHGKTIWAEQDLPAA